MSDEAVTKFRGSYSGIGRMLRSPMMLAEMVSRAERVTEYAVETAPVWSGGDVSSDASPEGGYKSGFKIIPVPRGGIKKNRAQALVVNDDEAAIFVEYGTVNQEGQHILLKALAVLGTV